MNKNLRYPFLPIIVAFMSQVILDKKSLTKHLQRIVRIINIYDGGYLQIQWTLVMVNSVLSPILFTNERCLLFSM